MTWQNAVDAAASWTSDAGSGTDMPVHMVLSNVAGSLSILCWFIVFTPQLWVNYKRQSGESLSLPFLYIWLAGDFFNVAGATMDNLLLTMRILAWYYTIADILLIAQVYYYRRLREQSKINEDGTQVEPGNFLPENSHISAGPTSSDHTRCADDIEELDSDETSTLLPSSLPPGSNSKGSISSYSAISSVPSTIDGSDLLRHGHLHSIQETDSTRSSVPSGRTLSSAIPSETATDITPNLQKRRRLRQLFLVVLPILATAFLVWSLVEWHNCVRGERGHPSLFGNRAGNGNADVDLDQGMEIHGQRIWSNWSECKRGRGHGRGKLPPSPAVPTQDVEKMHGHPNHDDSDRDDDTESGLTTALILGWSSAALYLGSRVPQIYKNWRLRSCEGLSVLMFVFSLLGNTLFIASIFLSSTERSYLIRNMPWWLGSAGTLVFDLIIFIQFFIYKEQVPE
ncbi:hypothetical protein KVV02_008600 [Mortierella alpina]|uniref:PQ-loop-domain-containing protein n=1 Tax=Mortierella alpina TaxID=64518 RepID=A0A9P8CZE7_MORAP|nr:hypothetical protein KVV02_008600 [Mortierella alpina]